MTRHLQGRQYRLQPLFVDSFGTTEHWHCEGIGAKLGAQDGWLYCDARGGDVQAATVWCTALEFADPLWIEFDVRFLDGRFNGNLILHARSEGGGDVLASSSARTGEYGEYHVFANYIVTFLNDADGVRVRYRRNPGFALLDETFYQPLLELNRTYHMVLILQAGRLQLFVDGTQRYDGMDPAAPLLAGRFAWRTWRTFLGWSNLSIYRLL